MTDALFRQFANPSSAYRGKPFWAWNGKLDPPELRRQIRVMQQMGLGGFFMHARVGLDTAYLSEDWFTCVEGCIDEAEKLGMEAWLYDEDRWPSGAAGGLVTKAAAHRMRYLAMDVLERPRDLKWGKDVLAAFTATVDGATASGVRWIARGKSCRPADGESILAFRVKTAPLSSWYNGYTYLDTLSHDAVNAFTEVTHEAYRQRNGRHFGKTVPGIFTDEPNHGSKFGRHQDTNDGHGLPWTPKLLAVFTERYGYDLREHLPELFLDIDGEPITPARHDYHDCVTFLFSDAFSRQLGEWCERNDLALTGHVLFEPTLSYQTLAAGSCMRFYEHMQAPGMDILGQFHREYDTAKQVSSAARQFGRKWRLTETYGCTGWDFPFLGHKAIGDWQVALGINLRCPHLSWYTMVGEAKRDYPASILHQSPWWEIYATVEDYFARIHTVMTRGVEVRDLLIVHPVESMWMMCRMDWFNTRSSNAYDRVLIHLRDTLLAANIDFDYGDEDILSRHAKVSRRGGAVALVVGKAVYKTIVVPPLKTVRASTLRLLKRFKDAGGTVVMTGRPPDYVDAIRSTAAVDFAADCITAPARGDALAEAVEQSCRRVSITNGDGREIAAALHLLREDKDAFYLFVCNVGHDFRGHVHDIAIRDRTAQFEDVRIRGFAECKGNPIELDAPTGRRFRATATRVRDQWEIRTTLPTLGSRLFIVPRKKSRKSLPRRDGLHDVRVRQLNDERWQICLSECNNLVLDRPRCRIGAGNWRKDEEILRLDRRVRDKLGIPWRGGMMVQPWVRLRQGFVGQARAKQLAPDRLPLELSYSFDVTAIPSGDLFLGIERPELYRIRINGVSVSTDTDCGWWTDKSLRKVPVEPSLLRAGRNELTLHCDYDVNHPGLELVYLLGSFGVNVRGRRVTVTAMPASLALGNWVKQGLAFYSGSVSYQKTIRPRVRRGERLFVQVSGFDGTAVRVIVDGQLAGVIAWAPHEVEITDLLADGGSTLAIQVVGHRRNSHGPLHLNEKQPWAIGPNEFMTTDKRWNDNYQLVPLGLTAPPCLVTRKG